MKQYYTYIATNYSRTLYVGVTNDLERRMQEHKNKTNNGFTNRYNVTELVYFQDFSDINEAIAAEKRLKGWSRAKKVELIESLNPTWQDLSADWFEQSSTKGTKDSSPCGALNDSLPGHAPG